MLSGILEPALEALLIIFEPRNFALVVLATLLGLVMGVMPGIGGFIALALLIPLTFHMSPEVALMILAATLGGVNFGGAITAILINTPGTVGNLATLLDGYPMARAGQANEAIAAAAFASVIGALVGLFLLVVTLPFLIIVVLSFNPWDVFWIAIIGLAVIAFVTQGSFLKDLIAIGLGLFLVTHGRNQITGGTRFDWGILYLQDGVPLIPLALGLFAIAEMIHLGISGESISKGTKIRGKRMGGIKAVLTRPNLMARSISVGWVVGLIPGVGGSVANFAAYAQAKSNSPYSEKFGTGVIDGVIATEAANDAKEGGSLVPTLGLGIPGSASMAMMLAAFTLHGITPGPLLFEENMVIVFILIFALVISNIITSVVGILTTELAVKFTLIPIDVIIPAVILVALAGAFVESNQILDVIATGIFGVFGYALMKLGISRIALIIAFILGSIIEQNLHQSLQITRQDYFVFLTSPVLLLALATIVFALLYKEFKVRYAG